MYVTRNKIPGTPHHAKAGNINNALLKAPGSGDFVLGLDSDMIVHPDFLMRVLGHFYRRPDNNNSSGSAFEAPWILKDKSAFVQTPQVPHGFVLWVEAVSVWHWSCVPAGCAGFHRRPGIWVDH